MSSCPSSLRPELAGCTYHDVDIVSCHPSLEVGGCALMGKLDRIPRLIEYVNDRDAMLERIADHFKVDKSACKYAVLRVLNGGSANKWCIDMEISTENAEDQPDLRDLAGEALVIRQAFFEHVDAREPGTSDRLQQMARSFIEQKNVNLTRMGQTPKRVSNEAILRTAFSHCIFEVEDTVLTIIDRYFRKNRWTVGSLIYDGLHVESSTDRETYTTGGNGTCSIKQCKEQNRPSSARRASR